jgi:uncharacterized membrane protein YtjA (UPF0391 family)
VHGGSPSVTDRLPWTSQKVIHASRTAVSERKRFIASRTACRERAEEVYRESNGTRFATHGVEVIEVMLHMALVFLVIGLIAAVLGFTSIAGASIAIAKFLAGLFLVLFLVFLIIGMMATRKIVG